MSPRTILVVAEPFGKALSAVQVADAIGRGMRTADPNLQADLCPIDGLAADFDERMLKARAVVVAAEKLDRHTLLRRGAIFEIATRARQSGVPCYAVAEHNRLDLFEARVLDLQVVLEAGDVRNLRAAGRRLAGIV